MRPARRLVLAVLLLLVATLAACDLLPALEPEPAGPIVTVERHGGLCRAGECSQIVVIERDGRVHETEPDRVERGRLPEPLRVSLERAVRAADFGRLAAHPFTGQCPLAYDGQESVYTFSTVGGPVRLASCEVEIDPTDPLFAAVGAALAAAPRPADG